MFSDVLMAKTHGYIRDVVTLHVAVHSCYSPECS